MFKVGDKLRVVSKGGGQGFDVGDIVKVISIDDGLVRAKRDKDGKVGGATFHHRYELVESAPEVKATFKPEPKFKVGDKVRVIGREGHCFDVGDVVEVMRVDTDGTVRCKDDGGTEQWVSVRKLELVTEVRVEAPKVEEIKESVVMSTGKLSLLGHLQAQGFTKDEVMQVVKYREQFPTPADHERLPNPGVFYVGGDVLKQCVYGILAGKHIILEGAKGVGKNTLIDTLAFMFKRPTYEYPFNGNTDVASIIGEKTFDVDENGQSRVMFESNQLLKAMQDEAGAWFVADEVNMARAEVLSVMHAVTDYRGHLDVPGYGIVKANPAFRVIGTMNYGYMGTQELNEAFGDRFMIVHVPALKEVQMAESLRVAQPSLTPTIAQRLAKLFFDLDTKAQAGAISSKAVTVRGLYDTIDLVKAGCKPQWALQSCVVNKAFDQFERTQVQDVINTLFRTEEMWFITKSAPSVPAKAPASRIKSESL